MIENNDVLLTGFARLQEKSVLFNKYNEAIGVSLKVNSITGVISHLDSTDLTALEIEYLNDLICGKEILKEKGIEEIGRLISMHYVSSLRKPFFAGIKACRQRLEELREDKLNSVIIEE